MADFSVSAAGWPIATAAASVTILPICSDSSFLLVHTGLSCAHHVLVSLPLQGQCNGYSACMTCFPVTKDPMSEANLCPCVADKLDTANTDFPKQQDAVTAANDASSGQVKKGSNNNPEGAPDATWWLRDVNVSVGPGELVCVVGRVGSGKSSLIGALLGKTLHTAAFTAIHVNNIVVDCVVCWRSVLNVAKFLCSAQNWALCFVASYGTQICYLCQSSPTQACVSCTHVRLPALACLDLASYQLAATFLSVLSILLG